MERRAPLSPLGAVVPVPWYRGEDTEGDVDLGPPAGCTSHILQYTQQSADRQHRPKATQPRCRFGTLSPRAASASPSTSASTLPARPCSSRPLASPARSPSGGPPSGASLLLLHPRSLSPDGAHVAHPKPVCSDLAGGPSFDAGFLTSFHTRLKQFHDELHRPPMDDASANQRCVLSLMVLFTVLLESDIPKRHPHWGVWECFRTVLASVFVAWSPADDRNLSQAIGDACDNPRSANGVVWGRWNAKQTFRERCGALEKKAASPEAAGPASKPLRAKRRQIWLR
ncbi:hypothetical protein DIPPA_01752 [Diplonema papillatum]|nr:hypothetical protein DIPPA_01752 [Diplonema papillatum]